MAGRILLLGRSSRLATEASLAEPLSGMPHCRNRISDDRFPIDLKLVEGARQGLIAENIGALDQAQH